jgi:hypothetical protein
MVIVTMTPSRDVPQSDYPKSGSRQQVHLHQIGDSALITLAIFVERIAVVSAIHPSITKRGRIHPSKVDLSLPVQHRQIKVSN